MSQYTVYQFIDAAGETIYVGATGNLDARLHQHSHKTWWPEVDHYTFEVCESREAMLDREKELTYELNPRHNVNQGGSGRRAERRRNWSGQSAEDFDICALALAVAHLHEDDPS